MDPENTGKPLDTAAESSAPARQTLDVEDIQQLLPLERLMRRPEVERITGLTRSPLYRLMAKGEFPAQVHISANAVGWLSSEVHAWVARRAAARK